MLEKKSNVFTRLNHFATVLSLAHFVTDCLSVFSPSLFSPSGGSGQGLSEGERTGCIGVAESDIISDVAIGQAITHIVWGRVQRGGLRQEVSPSSCIIRAVQTNSGNTKHNHSPPSHFQFFTLGSQVANHTLFHIYTKYQ